MKKSIISLMAMAVLASACTTTDPYTQEQKVSKATWGTMAGAAGGAAVGALTSKNKGKGALIGAAAGAAVGGGVGYYMDTQEAQLREELASTGVSVLRSGDEILLIMPGNITFTSDSSDINSGFYATLNSIAKVFKKYDTTTIMVSGYTDNTGTDAHNDQLSKQRANSVAAYLQSQGLKAARFTTLGFGKSNPIASNATAAGRQQNRRVEIKIIPNK